MTLRVLIFLAAFLLAPAASAQTITDLGWLEGCWRTAPGGTQRVSTTMVWTAPMPAVLGHFYEVREGHATQWEQQRIETIGSAAFLILNSKHGWSDRLRLSETENDYARFTREGQDWPYIDYRRRGLTLIVTHARSGLPDLDIVYHRISCEEALRP